MKIKNIFLTALLVTVLVGYGCKKGDLGEPKHLPFNVPHVPNILNMFKVKLTLHQSQPYAMGENNVMNISPTDSVLIDYTIESPDDDMYQVALYKTGGGLPQIRIPITDTMDRRTYSGQFMFYGADLGAGSSTTYRIWGNDRNGVYLGDGGRKMTINVSSDMQYYTNKRVLFPDSATGVAPCYVSLSDGELYSYSTGADHSATIDMGLFTRNDTTDVKTGDVNGDGKLDTISFSLKKVNYLYSLAADPLPFTYYDVSSWTKRGTLFSKPVKKGSVTDMPKKFNVGAKIESEAKKQKINLTMVPSSAEEAESTPLAAGQYIYFLTPEGKYGVILIQSISYNYRLDAYMQLIWRIQN